MPNLILRGAAAAGALTIFMIGGTASAQIIEAHQAIPKKGTDTEIGTTRIVVDGKGTTRYDMVRTRKLDAWVSVKAPDKPPRDKEKLGGRITLEGGDIYQSKGFYPSPAIFKISFDYVDFPSREVANTRVSAIKMCNDRLDKLTGSARAAFLKKGETFLYENAYVATATQSWRVRKKNSVFQEVKSWKDYAGINAVIECRPLEGPKPRTNTSTSGSDAKPPSKAPDPARAAPTPDRVAQPPRATASVDATNSSAGNDR